MSYLWPFSAFAAQSPFAAYVDLCEKAGRNYRTALKTASVMTGIYAEAAMEVLSSPEPHIELLRQSVRGVDHLRQLSDISGGDIRRAYDDAVRKETAIGKSPPWIEPAPDLGVAPDATEILKDYPFYRLYHFAAAEKSDPHVPTALIFGPDSGTGIEVMRPSLHAFRKAGFNVCLVATRDPRAVPIRFKKRPVDSIAAFGAIMDRFPRSHRLFFSQSGVPGVAAAAHRGINDGSMTVIGSPLNTGIARDSLCWIAQLTPNDPAYDPVCIPVSAECPGTGRNFFPGAVQKLFYRKGAAGKLNATPQDMDEEHLRGMIAHFRDNELARGELVFEDEKIDLSRIACPVRTYAGAEDRIVPARQTHDLGKWVADHKGKTIPGMDHYDMLSEEVLSKHVIPEILAIHAKQHKRQPEFACV